MKLQLQMKRRKNRKEVELKRTEKEKKLKQDEEATCSSFSIPSDIESDDSYLSTSSASSTVQRTPVKRKRPINIVTAEVAAALDKTKVTDRMVVHNLVSFSKAFGHSPEEIALNRWTIRKSRRRHRISTLSNLQNKFSIQTKGPAVAHWDGKLLPHIGGKGHQKLVDRFPILVSDTNNNEQLLNVPKLSNGTGRAIANAVVESLKKWSIETKVKALSFDTTVTNSGIKSGAAVLIEKELTQNMLHLACRHHIHEILLGDVFTLLFGPFRNPEITMCKCFKQKWSSLCHAQFEPITTGRQSVAILDANKDLANETLSLCFSCLTVKFLLAR